MAQDDGDPLTRRLLTDLHRLAQSPLILDPVEVLPDAELAEMWAVLDHVARIVEARKALIRVALLDASRARGAIVPGGPGSTKLAIGSRFVVMRKLMGSGEYKKADVEKLLMGKNIPTEAVIDAVPTTTTKHVVSVSKLKALIDNGMIAEDEAKAAFTPPSEALEVFEATGVFEALEREMPLLEGMKRKGSRV